MTTATLQQVEDLIDSTISIPTVPTTLVEITRIFNDPNGSAREAADVIATDPAIAAQVLRIANRSIYGLRNPVTSVQLAISILGLRVLKNVVVQATVLNLGASGSIGGFSADWLWDHSFKVACAARELVSFVVGAELDADEAYTCGLLHDVGEMILLKQQATKLAEALRISSERNVPLDEAECQVLGFSHAHAGAVLTRRWGLSDKIVTAVLWHHPQADGDQPPIGRLIGVADLLAQRAAERTAAYATRTLDDQMLQQVGLLPQHAERIVAAVRKSRAGE